MTIRVLVVLAATAPGLWSYQVDHGERYTVTVCLESAGFFTLSRASSLVSGMYAAIGVDIDWRWPRNCPTGAIRVTMQMSTPIGQSPGAMAYAAPYEGTRIVIFYDRVEKKQARPVPELLAHVLAHEIGHILEGISRHSASGVMKAQWDEDDFSQMAWKPLPFTPEDVILIHQGLRSRAAALAKSH
jgi:hypothetical protein